MHLLTIILVRPVLAFGPSGESAWTRVLRWIDDCGRLTDLDDRMLRDIGLTREDVLRGTPFKRSEFPSPDAKLRPSFRTYLGSDWA